MRRYCKQAQKNAVINEYMYVLTEGGKVPFPTTAGNIGNCALGAFTKLIINTQRNIQISYLIAGISGGI